MCSSECERVSNLTPISNDQYDESVRPNFTRKMYQHSQQGSCTTIYSRSYRVCLTAVCLVLFLSSAVESAAIAKRRAVSEENTSQQSDTKICTNNTPCGWAVYIPISRKVDYYMKNVCDCPYGKDCLKSEDDLSVNAYVYRCKEKSPPSKD